MNLIDHVGKKFTNNTSGEAFDVAAFLPAFDFGARRGGKKDAFTIVRESDNAMSTVACAQFLADFSPVLITQTVTTTTEAAA